MYPENPEGIMIVIVGSMNMGYSISDTARNQTHNMFRPKCEPITLGHSDGNQKLCILNRTSTVLVSHMRQQQNCHETKWNYSTVGWSPKHVEVRASLTTEASKTIAAAIVGSRLDFCNSLLAGTSVSNLTCLQHVQFTLARAVARKPRFCTLHLSFRICIGFRFATELALKLLRLLSKCSNFSSHPILHRSSQDMYRREHSALLRLSQYLFPCKVTMAASKSVASNTCNALPNHLSSIPSLPA